MKEKQLEEIRKLREGIIANLKQKITLHSVRSGYGVFNITSWEDIADSLLRNLPIPLYLDTGELMDEEICKAVGCAIAHKINPSPCPFQEKRGCNFYQSGSLSAKAARAKFVSIKPIMEQE